VCATAVRFQTWNWHHFPSWKLSKSGFQKWLSDREKQK